MADLNAPWAGDLSLSPTGGLELISGAALTQQRLIRRLLTNPGDYIWEPGYGAGLPAYVGVPMGDATVAAISAVVQDQALLEETVSSVTSVSVSAISPTAYGVTIAYAYAPDGSAQTLSLTIS